MFAQTRENIRWTVENATATLKMGMVMGRQECPAEQA